MRKIEEIKKILYEQRDEIKKRFGVKEIGIFGSYTREEQTNESDIDILVEFSEGYKTFDNYMDLKFYLEELLNVSVDLIMKSALKPALAPKILQEVIYV
ncbi:nucleotidyltransferase family protein [Thermodesulfovibrio thiophilus]|uniref:nucleotidyltransferase family protein n=1 Tax=Thermodesulfovibrio thiophilus TaxID=340095 RepID=UPI0004056543|nr:nucleotidyltransferase family protein [Thermodesulfovibrio thiophilus]